MNARPAVGVALAAVLSVATVLTFQVTGSSPRCLAPSAGPTLTPIRHVFFIVKENHAFENYFGDFPGARGFPPHGSFPTAFGSESTIHPFALTSASTPDLPHDHASGLTDLDGGRNDRFVAQAAALGAAAPDDAVGYYTEAQLPDYYAYAREYALGDMFFTGVLGPTWPNRFFDLSAATGSWTDNSPPPSNLSGVPNLLSELSAQGVPWAYDYSGDPTSITPYLFASVRADPCVSARIVPIDNLPGQLGAPVPPSVVIVDPENDGVYSEHPPANITTGEAWTVAVVNAIFRSPIGNSSAVFLYWDENGGFWDPVSPPLTSAVGDGFRVPLLVLSPYTPAGRIVHQILDPAALLRFVDDNWGMPYLNGRVAVAPLLTSFFDFAKPPRAPLLMPTGVALEWPSHAPEGRDPAAGNARATPSFLGSAIIPRWIRKP